MQGPHGVAFALAPSLQAAVLNEFALGESLHTLAASVTFYIPFYNILLKVSFQIFISIYYILIYP